MLQRRVTHNEGVRQLGPYFAGECARGTVDESRREDGGQRERACHLRERDSVGAKLVGGHRTYGTKRTLLHVHEDEGHVLWGDRRGRFHFPFRPTNTPSR